MRTATRLQVFIFLAASTLQAQGTTYVPATELPNGKEIMAVYVGATTCGPCHSPAVKSAVQKMKVLVFAQAKQKGAAFSVIGVSTDWAVADAASFLDPNGPFDQIVLGGNWTNLGVERFIWRDSTGSAAMPQIAIFERTVTPGRRITFSEPRLLRRVVGAEAIPSWVEAGAPIAEIKKQ